MECEEKVVILSGRSCWSVCQKVAEKEITRAIAGACQMLLM